MDVGIKLKKDILKGDPNALYGVYVPNSEPGWIRCYWGDAEDSKKLITVLQLKNEAFSTYTLDDVLSVKCLQECPAHARMGDHHYVFNFEKYTSV